MAADEREEVIKAVARQIAAIMDVATNSPRADKIFRSMAEMDRRIAEQNQDGWRIAGMAPVTLTETELDRARRWAMDDVRGKTP